MSKPFSEYKPEDFKREVKTLVKMKPAAKLLRWFLRVHQSGATLVAEVVTKQGEIQERGCAL